MSTATDGKIDIRTVLPLTLPIETMPCPICGKAVIVAGVQCWATETGEMEEVDFDCETEPDLDSDEYEDWFHEHHEYMPYVYWLPYQERLLEWLNETYYMGSGK